MRVPEELLSLGNKVERRNVAINHIMSDKSNLEFVGQMKPHGLTSMEEDSRNELTQIHADQALFAKYGRNSVKKASPIEGSQVEEATRERFPYGGMDTSDVSNALKARLRTTAKRANH